jgi:hypothetical protein
MIIYNVTCHVDDDVLEEWVAWMASTHVPEVMATGKFIKYKFSEISKSHADDAGTSFSIQFFAEDIQNYQSYQNEDAPQLIDKTTKKFGTKVAAFRTILHLIAEGTK